MSALADAGGDDATISEDGPAESAAERSGPLLAALLLPGMSAVHANAIERMQKVQGNGAVARMVIQRDPPTPTNIAGPAPAAVPADLQAFRDRGPMPAAAQGQLIQPVPVGCFQARYDPVGMNRP